MRKINWIGVIFLLTIFVNLMFYMAGVNVTGILYIPDWPLDTKNNIIGAMLVITVVSFVIILLHVLVNIERDKTLLGEEDERDKK